MSKKQAEFLNWLGPILDALRELDGSGKPREVSEAIASRLNLSDSILNQTLKSGESRFHNQVAWARQYLVWEGLLEKDSRGTWILTPKGEKTSLSVEDSRKIVKKWVSIYTKARKETDKNVIVDVSIDAPAEFLRVKR
ncbi:winged helix-turn-helix domain-containing protein [Pedobacter sp. UC225_61]|uniref:winged helix-turn-helix domain-containing protein n=1 Tax=Pedobacter sp. UC225_61 TaxID=3374623 RepID=UPI0037A049DD